MLDDFYTRALLGGIGTAVAAGPLGCFVVWRRMAYFGDSLAHGALLGVALGLVFDVGPMPGVALASVVLAALLTGLETQRRLASDTLLGILAHASLALGLVILSLVGTVRVDLTAYLFGDVLAVSRADLAGIWAGTALVLLVLSRLWRPLVFATLNEELARAEGVRVVPLKFALVLMVASVVAAAMKIVGVVLITALLIIPAAAARRFAPTPEAMALVAALLGVVAVIGGLRLSLVYDTPSGPSIVVAALGLFLASLALGGLSDAVRGLTARRRGP